MMTGDNDLRELMEEYIRVADLIGGMITGDLEIVLEDSKGNSTRLEELVTTDALYESIAADLMHYQEDLAEQIKELLD